MKQNVLAFFKQFPDDDTCLEHLFEVSYGQGHECPKCERDAKWYRIKSEKAFSCQWCGHHIHPMVGTPFQQSRTSLQLWFFAIFLFIKSRNGVSAKELERQLGVTYKTAWRMGHEIRKHMAGVDGETPLGGIGKIVEADETYIGGYEKGAMGGKGKAIVVGLVEKDGDVMTFVVPNRSQASLVGPILNNVHAGTTIHTDTAGQYTALKHFEEYTHLTVDHSISEYVGKDGQTTNTIEGFFFHLKRTIKGTHIWVSPKHLPKYAKEAEFMYNRRKAPNTMLPDLLSTFPLQTWT
ncbi:IS1595 family transposase [Litorimonas sp. RW-G-Af-16]|uniref:IS1595 family transposase n=1 Tax=Litorimonas sp. RW-G-Af-16 TaxID=3241168 RepID=UPI00390CB5FF